MKKWFPEPASSKIKKIPKDHTDSEFNVDCYSKNNPEITKELGSDKEKLTSHWIDIGSKQGYDASCESTKLSKEERMKIMEDRLKKEALVEGLRTACTAANRYWVESSLTCDGTRNSDGTTNTFAEECKQKNSYWDTEGRKSFCNVFKDQSGNIKSDKERCNTLNNYWDGSKCNTSKNVDGTYKTMEDLCSGFDIFFDGQNCNYYKNTNGEVKSYKKDCENLSGLYLGEKFDIWSASWGAGTENIDVTEYIKKKIRFAKEGEEFLPGYNLNSNQIIIPKFNFEDDWKTLFKSKDPAPYKNKYFTIQFWTSKWGPVNFNGERDGQKNQFELPRPIIIIENTELKPIKDDRDFNRCNIEFFPDGRYKGNEYIEKVDGGLLKPEDAGFTMNRPPGDLFDTGQYLQIMVNSPEFQQNKNKAKQTTNIEPPRGSGKKGKTLTLYYADWCPHCHNMMPEWNKLGKSHKGIQIIAIEQKQNKSFPVNSYPTIIFRDGKKMEKYEGPRTKSSFVKFLKNKLT